MIRKIIQIDEALCNGCGLCAAACHEGAIGMVAGKAKLLRDDYCDGLGDCLPTCPTGAITFVEREAAAYDEAAVKARLSAMGKTLPVGGCPGSQAQVIQRGVVPSAPETQPVPSQLAQWPVQIKLAPLCAPYFHCSNLLIAADCTAFAYGNFHQQFMKNRVTLIGCPKLDEGDYSDKLTEILRQNEISSVTVARMEVPCCSGIANAVQQAIRRCGRPIPWQIVTVSTGGQILENRGENKWNR